MAWFRTSKELVVKFKDAFDMIWLISRATDHGESRGGDQLIVARATDHG